MHNPIIWHKCEQCGTKVVEEALIIKCEQCGTKVVEEALIIWHKCEQCGTKVVEEALMGSEGCAACREDFDTDEYFRLMDLREGISSTDDYLRDQLDKNLKEFFG